MIALIERGVRVLTSSSDNLTETSNPIKIAMRQSAGVFARLEKAAAGREAQSRSRSEARHRREGEGRKSYRQIDDEKHVGKMIAMVKQLRRRTDNR